ncbi:hypothetical protein D3C85_1928090 [compost metagenome]
MIKPRLVTLPTTVASNLQALRIPAPESLPGPVPFPAPVAAPAPLPSLPAPGTNDFAP